MNKPGIKGSSVISLKMPVCKGHPPAQQSSMAPHCLHGKDQTSRLPVRAFYTGVCPPLLSCLNLHADPVTHSVCLSKLLVAAFLPPVPSWKPGMPPLFSLPLGSVLPLVQSFCSGSPCLTLWAFPRNFSNIHWGSNLKKTLKPGPRIFSFSFGPWI